jgi:hypothetical protein
MSGAPSDPVERRRRRPVGFLGILTNRRSVLIGGLVAFAAACSRAVKKGTGGSEVPQPDLSPVPAGQRIPDEVLAQDAPQLNGTWKGTWSSSDGSSGPFQLKVAIDAKARTAHLEVSMGPGFYGKGSGPISESLDFDLDDYPYMKPPYRGASSVVGSWTLTGLGYGFVQLDTTNIPGHPEVATFHTKGYVFGPQVLPDGGLPFFYEIGRKDGTKVSGSTVLRV